MFNNVNTILFIVIASVVLLLVLYYGYRKNFKILKVPSVCLITGGVKTGKSLLSVNLSLKDYKRRHRIWWFKTHILKQHIDEPLYYTNVSISFGNLKHLDVDDNGKKHKQHRFDKNIRYITTDLLLRKKRFVYGSVIYVQESSLMADNMDYADKMRNIELSLFNKLIGHETHGGALYYDTQSPLDNHYSIKRVSSTYFFIQKSLNFILFRILYVRELINQENGVNAFNDDVDTTTRKVLIPRWYYHKYDRYEYSYLTDELPLEDKEFVRYNGLVSFNPDYIRLSDKRAKHLQERNDNNENI